MKLFSHATKILVFVAATVAPLLANAEPYRSFTFDVPLFQFGQEREARGEYNLGGRATVAVEATFISPGEEYSNREIDENGGDSLMTKGFEGSVFFARYTNPMSMSGFYWALGAGYRQMKADWHKTEDGTYTALVSSPESLDADGRMTHELSGSGVTGHARVGYRYVAETMPFVAGIYLGLRHFQSKFDDSAADDPTVAPSTEEERHALRDRLMTRLEPGIEVGFVF